jgi:hypothetical protein
MSGYTIVQQTAMSTASQRRAPSRWRGLCDRNQGRSPRDRRLAGAGSGGPRLREDAKQPGPFSEFHSACRLGHLTCCTNHSKVAVAVIRLLSSMFSILTSTNARPRCCRSLRNDSIVSSEVLARATSLPFAGLLNCILDLLITGTASRCSPTARSKSSPLLASARAN